MPATNVQITPTETILVAYDRWSGRTRILRGEDELCRFGISGGMQLLEVAGTDVEVDSHHSMLGQVTITVRVKGRIVAQNRWF